MKKFVYITFALFIIFAFGLSENCFAGKKIKNVNVTNNKTSQNDDLKNKISKTINNCNKLVQVVQKFCAMEGTFISNLSELKGHYLPDIDKLNDPWGNAFLLNTKKGIIYSKGPNGIDDLGKNDDISASYFGPLTLVDARIEINPKNGKVHDKKELSKTYDVLHLIFNKAVALPQKLDLSGSSKTIFNFFEIVNKKTVKIKVPIGLPSSIERTADCINVITSSNGLMGYGNDSREVLIRFPDGNTGKLTPGKYYINVKNNIKNYKNSFCEIEDLSNTYGGDGIVTVKPSAIPILIQGHLK